MSITSDDLAGLPHLVIVETEADLKLFEFEGAEAMEKAHIAATKIATADDFFGRTIVACRIRTTGPFSYAKKHSVGICR